MERYNYSGNYKAKVTPCNTGLIPLHSTWDRWSACDFPLPVISLSMLCIHLALPLTHTTDPISQHNITTWVLSKSFIWSGTWPDSESKFSFRTISYVSIILKYTMGMLKMYHTKWCVNALVHL